MLFCRIHWRGFDEHTWFDAPFLLVGRSDMLKPDNDNIVKALRYIEILGGLYGLKSEK